MENVAVSFVNRPEAIFTVIAAGISPDQNRLGENSGGIVETDPAFASVLACFASSHSNSIGDPTLIA